MQSRDVCVQRVVCVVLALNLQPNQYLALPWEEVALDSRRTSQ